MVSFTAGDRIAYTAKFLKNTGQFTGPSGQRRGEFLKYWEMDSRFARVRWDDFDQGAAAKQYGDDYALDATEHGQIVMACNIAKVGSARFALNDL